MNNTQKRVISLLLVLSMALGMCANSALASESAQEQSMSAVTAEDGSAREQEQESAQELEQAQEQESAKEPEQPEDESGAEQSLPEEDPDDQPEDESGAVSEAEDEDVSVVDEEDGEEAEIETDPADESRSEEAEASALQTAEDLSVQSEPESYTLNVTETVKLEKEYDDRFSFSEAKNGYVVAGIRDQQPTSFAVTRGVVRTAKDQAVVKLGEGSDAVAVGVGTATAVLVKSADLSAAKALLRDDGTATRNVDAVEVRLEVQPATLTLMFLAGQSNIEGYGSYTGKGKKEGRLYQHPEHSIVCPEGEVYSTYAPSSASFKTKGSEQHRSSSIGGGVNFTGFCSENTYKHFVAESLTSDESVDGSDLIYPLNQLTSAGKGKNGPDSGLAYEWNRLTGEKVWTVNAGWGGSSINRWVPGKDCYRRALPVFTTALKVYNAEIKAGHYKAGHKLCFWLQGEADTEMTAGMYQNQFRVMHKYLKKALNYERMGIISVRGQNSGLSGAAYRSVAELTMTGPRVAQTYLSNTKKFTDICIVSDANEQWATDSGVKRYFKKAYGKALSYKTHGKKPALPTKVSQVHNDIHYLQVAHNENGLTAARGMYQWMKGTAKASSVRWRDAKGQEVKSLNLSKGTTIVLSPAVIGPAASKGVTWRWSGGLRYNATSGKVTVKKNGAQKVEALDADGKVISTLIVARKSSLTTAPTLRGAANVKGKKIAVQWTKVTNATGYQVQYSTAADFSKAKVLTLRSSGAFKATLSGLKKKKTYYVHVRAFRIGSGTEYSPWSGAKKVKVTK